MFNNGTMGRWESLGREIAVGLLSLPSTRTGPNNDPNRANHPFRRLLNLVPFSSRPELAEPAGVGQG